MSNLKTMIIYLFIYLLGVLALSQLLFIYLSLDKFLVKVHDPEILEPPVTEVTPVNPPRPSLDIHRNTTDILDESSLD